MKRKLKMLRVIGVLSFIGILMPASSALNAEEQMVREKPNIIFFIADDMYPDMFNCLPEGKGKNLTPNIDRLTKEGVVMMNQYVVSPVCTPSRYNCLTGKYASRAINEEFREKTLAEGGQTVIQWNSFITAGEKILPHYLQEAGYRTGMVGKNHVIEVKDLEEFDDYWADPQKPEIMAKVKRNYIKTCAAVRNNGFDFAESIYFDNPNWIGLGKLAVQNNDWITQGGVDFIDQFHKEPFFLYFATTIPHQPSDPERSWKADPLITANGYLDKALTVLPPRETLPVRIKEAGLEGDNKELLLWLDDSVGALMNKLEDHGILDNTLIFFFNDHGQKAKGHLYQGGVHSPSIIWHSKGFKCGKVSDAMVQNIDFAPTILDFAGVNAVADQFDGTSFKPVLDGDKSATREDCFFELGYARGVIKDKYKYYAVRYPEYAEHMTAEQRAEELEAYNVTRRIRKMTMVNQDPAAPFSHFSVVPGGEHAEHESYGRTKAYFDPDQLYDLESDPMELNNLANIPEHSETMSEMKSLLKGYLKNLPGSFGDLKSSPSLRDLVKSSFPEGNVYIGGATGHRYLNTQDSWIVRNEFSYITPDNDFKQSLIHPEPGVWRWDIPDHWIKMAERDDQVIRIHGPISPQASSWAYGDDRTSEELLTNLREFMTELCKRYDGHPNVRWMDVVNETVDMVKGNGWNRPRPGTRGYENPWPRAGMIMDIPSKYKSLQDGVPLYIVEAFKIANKYAPKTKQIINQHGYMQDYIWDRIRDLIPYLREEHGIRVDGIGWQGHIQYFKDHDWSMEGDNISYLGDLIDWAHGNDLEFHLTEINIHDIGDEPSKESEYADVFGNILSTILSKRNGGVVSWSVWYFTDRPHFRMKNKFLNCLWDKNYQPHDAYHRVQNLLMYPPKADKNTDGSLGK